MHKEDSQSYPIFANTFDFYQEVARKTNDFYFQLENVVLIKLYKMSDALDIEIHVFNEEFDNPIYLSNQNEFIIRYIADDVNRVVDLLKSVQKDTSMWYLQNQINEDTKDYYLKMIEVAINSILEYEMFVFAVDDTTKPEKEILTAMIIGNLSTSVGREGLTLTQRCIRDSIQSLLPNLEEDFIPELVSKYNVGFKENCQSINKFGQIVYN